METHKRVRTVTHQKELWDKGIGTSLEHKQGITEKDGEIIAQSHDHIAAGHPGVAKTRELVLREYWWPKMKKDVKTYIGGCETCQRTKSSNQAKSTPLHPNAISTEPWTHISVNMITGLPTSNRHDALLVVVDRFSKAIILVPCNVELSTEGWARILQDHVYTRHGMPQVVISDRGPQFVSEFMKELYQMLNIMQNTSIAFHPQMDGQTERVNQEVEKYLRIFINHQQTDWADWLPLAEFSHNNRAHSVTRRSPFMILYGRNPHIIPNSPRPANSKVPATSDFSKTMNKIHKETEAALEEATGRMKVQYDKHKRPAKEYHAGDLIWLDTTNLHLSRPKKKLNNKRVRPFKILKKTGHTGASAYKLKLPPHWKIHLHFNEKLLTPYTPPVFPNQEQPLPPPPDLINNEEQWELKEWKGWTQEHNSWVTEKDMGNAKEAIADYVKRTKRNERVAIVKIATTPRSPLAMIVNHHYSDDGDFSYLMQREDGTQKWVLNPNVNKYKDFLEEYWASYHSSQEPPMTTEP
ncbi:uncharacterized protein ARMOST_13831 [Armillaria ostoyae]|uniref:Integrase catalytic domain-containing protein n=1 Tax=Armillaria ostoyae TaxID=47428 RepID=A0A284RP08_ARMOS|nr:uncharacterized protein ARMOST_13831 [Armillaria ostoyae]